jgi:hypothetical protein
MSVRDGSTDSATVWAEVHAGSASWGAWVESRLAEVSADQRAYIGDLLAEVARTLVEDLDRRIEQAIASLRPLRNLEIAGTYDGSRKYRALDTVALNGASFCARTDDPGSCPGDGWQMIASQGKKGAPGVDGRNGRDGRDAPRIESWLINRESYSCVPIMSDGSRGAVLELRELFQRFNDETAP